MRLSGEEMVAASHDRLYIHEHIGGVGRAFQIDERDAAERLCPFDNRADFLLRRTGGEIEPLHAELAEDAADQRFGGSIKRRGMDDHIAGLDEGEQRGRDGRHATGKQQGVFRFLPHRQPVFGNFLIGAVEAGIDQPFRTAGSDPGDAFKMPFACGGAFKGEGGGEEDGRLQRSFRQHRVVAMAHHQRRGLQLASADLHDGWLGTAALARGLGA